MPTTPRDTDADEEEFDDHGYELASHGVADTQSSIGNSSFEKVDGMPGQADNRDSPEYDPGFDHNDPQLQWYLKDDRAVQTENVTVLPTENQDAEMPPAANEFDDIDVPPLPQFGMPGQANTNSSDPTKPADKQ